MHDSSDLKSLDNQIGLIAKLNEIKEQQFDDDDSASSCNKSDDGVKHDEEVVDESKAPSRQEPNLSDPKNKHFNYA